MADLAPAASATAAPGQRRLFVLLGLAAAAVAIAIVVALVFGGPGRHVETGIVVSVEATSLTAVQGFTILTTDGRRVEFRLGTLENATAFAPSHLAEHKVSLAPVHVTYVDRDGSHVAVLIDDAP